MTDPWARPFDSESQDSHTTPPDQADTVGLTPFSYGGPAADQPASEATLVDPLANPPQQPSYSNPTFSAYPSPQPVQPAPSYPAPTPASTSYSEPPGPYDQPTAYSSYDPYGQPTGFQHAQVVPAQPAPYGYPPAYSAQLPEHPNAVPALILGIAGFFTGITFPIAWIVGAKGTSEMNRYPGRWRPSSMLTAGKWIGIIGTLLGVVMVIFVILLAFVAAAYSM